MSKNIRTEAVDHLFEAILCLKDKEECYTFFEDVCTINELLSLSQRFEDRCFHSHDQPCKPFSELWQ